MADPIVVNINGVGKVNFPPDFTPDQIKFAIENDILPRVQAQSAKQDKPVVVSAGESLKEIPRQIGLTARYGAEGLADLAGIGTEPIRAFLNPALRSMGLPQASSTRYTVSQLLDKAGFPSPEGANERVVGDATRLMAGSAGIAGAAQKAGSLVTNPTARTVISNLGENVGQQVAAGAGAGGAGGSVREAGGGPVAQFVASLAGGLTAAGLTSLATKAYDTLASALRGKPDINQVNVTINQLLQQAGVDPAQVSAQVRDGLAAEVRRALDTGGRVNPDVVRRLADYGAVGATPTRGTATLDPVQITQEKNLAKLGANSSDPRLQQLARVQNDNNARLIENLNELGANTPNADPLRAGSVVTGAIRSRDAAAAATENSLYSRARDSSGRAIELDRDGFVSDAYNRLAQTNKGAFLPDQISKVLEQLRTGKTVLPDGREVPLPFTVDTIDNLKTMLATASRNASDGNVRSALAQVRNALESTQPRAVGRPVGGNQVVDPAQLAAAQSTADTVSTESMRAFDTARRYASARRTWQESAEGITAALNDIPPDRFVRDYIIGSSNKAATAEVERMLFTVRRSPEAAQALKENVVAYLKNKALNGAADEVGNFSPSAFNKALNELGDQKLRLFFNPEEVAQLRAIGRVSAYETFQPRGSAVNNSNTAGGVMGILDRIAQSPLLSKIPFGDAAIRQPAQNWSAQIQAGKAMNPYAAAVEAGEAPRPQLIRDLMGPGLLLAAPRAQGREDQKRR